MSRLGILEAKHYTSHMHWQIGSEQDLQNEMVVQDIISALTNIRLETELDRIYFKLEYSALFSNLGM